MSVEERVAKIESDMGHVRSTLADIKDDMRSVKGEAQELRTELHTFKEAVAKEFALVRVDTAKEFELVRGEIASARMETAGLRTETTKEFGSVKEEIAKVRTAIESTKVWILVTGFGAVVSIVGTLAALHALKLF